jgi:DNA-binding NarL/FixJ family response regulator
MSGFELCRDIRLAAPEARVVLLSASDEACLRRTASRAGASAFVWKLCAVEQLEQAVHSAARGERYLPPKKE